MSNWRNSNRYEDQQQPSFNSMFDTSSSLNRSRSFNDNYSASDEYGQSYDRYSATGGYGSSNNRFSVRDPPAKSYLTNEESYSAPTRSYPSNDKSYFNVRDSSMSTDGHTASYGTYPQEDNRYGGSSLASYSHDDNMYVRPDKFDKEGFDDDHFNPPMTGLFDVARETLQITGKLLSGSSSSSRPLFDMGGEEPKNIYSDEEEEEEGDDQGQTFVKEDVFIPDLKTVQKFQYFPPTAQEMRELFKGFVIVFLHKHNRHTTERSAFVNICESFRRSSNYGGLEVEDSFQRSNPSRKYCTLRYNGMLLARGCSNNKIIKEARVRAAAELINKLAMSCYILKTRDEYFNKAAIDNLVYARYVPGVFRVVTEEEGPTTEICQEIMSDFFREDTDAELIFTKCMGRDLFQLKKYALALRLNLRTRVAPDVFIGIFKDRTPEYWVHKMLAAGVLGNEKYKLIPPLGIGKMYFKEFDIQNMVGGKKQVLRVPPSKCYASGNAGLEIQVALPPWERRGGGLKQKHTRKKLKRVMESIEAGEDPTHTTQFRYLNKKNKKRIRAMMGSQ